MEKKKSKISFWGCYSHLFRYCFLIIGITGYLQQLGQKDWPMETAAVINVDQRTESSGSRHGYRHRRTVYDITYQYEANGNVYTGEIFEKQYTKKLGETFSIKFNPDTPNSSVEYTEPSLVPVLSGLAAFIVFGFIGFRMIQKSFTKNKFYLL